MRSMSLSLVTWIFWLLKILPMRYLVNARQSSEPPSKRPALHLRLGKERAEADGEGQVTDEGLDSATAASESAVSAPRKDAILGAQHSHGVRGRVDDG